MCKYVLALYGCTTRKVPATKELFCLPIRTLEDAAVLVYRWREEQKLAHDVKYNSATHADLLRAVKYSSAKRLGLVHDVAYTCWPWCRVYMLTVMSHTQVTVHDVKYSFATHIGLVHDLTYICWPWCCVNRKTCWPCSWCRVHVLTLILRK